MKLYLLIILKLIIVYICVGCISRKSTLLDCCIKYVIYNCFVYFYKVLQICFFA